MGAWGRIVIGVKVNSYEEVQKLFAKLGGKMTIEQIKQEDFDTLAIKEWIDLSDHPDNEEYKKEYNLINYRGTLEPQFDHEYGYGWGENEISDVVIGVLLFDTYSLGNEIPHEYIMTKLAEIQTTIPDAKLYLVHEHS